MKLFTCPRCKQKVLNPANCGESGIYKSKHIICVHCFDDEDKEINEKGNDLPEVLASYDYSNEYLLD